MRRGVAVFGATGSIGRSTLAVLREHPDQFRLEVISAHANLERLNEILRVHQPRHVVITQSDQWKASQSLRAAFPAVVFHAGMEALNDLAAMPEVEIVVASIVGAAGLRSTLAAVRAGKQVLLANKEALVMAGTLVMAEAARTGAIILPVDSEHNAIFQCLPHAYRTGQTIPGLHQLILTCSGGPFRTLETQALQHVTPEMACQHPNWSMGAKISVDSATLMNKGLELIEACHLFAVAHTQIDVVVHPQSVVHSMVEFQDGSVLAQLGSADMRIPIAFSLGYPARLSIDAPRIQWQDLRTLEFESPRHEDFPAIELARASYAEGDDRPLVLNAANEIAVAAFLSGQIRFPEIMAITLECLNRLPRQPISVVDEMIVRDAEVRGLAKQLVEISVCS
ncbi:MAG: 1-deoxy-D-xylulose-5-phosphate reductoisomerase [Gammaproteobacteria bacterium]|nr:1-deoxy-D-xylulose-5-phosphate reductoisomerase [Gammaproteobacteria bacterium]